MNETGEKGSATKVREGQLNLPFDQYQRYRIVADAIDRLREDGRPLRVLDVGGAEGIILHFLPGDEVTILDLAEAEDVPGFVQGDATAMPFADDEFDYVVSVDTYEHIAPEQREAYLSELRRTAREAVLLAAPFDSEAVRGAERAANEFHRAMHGADNVWLLEHAEHGLPSLGEARRFYDELGDAVTVLPNGYLPHWLAMICLTFQRPKLGEGLADALDAINAYYNESLYHHDNTEPCYRYLLVCRKDAAGRAELEDLASTRSDNEQPASGLALFGALPVALPMAAEMERSARRLAEHERLLARAEGELERKDFELETTQVQNADLSRRIAELVAARNGQVSKAEQHLRNAEQRLRRAEQRLGEVQQVKEELEKRNARLRRQSATLQRQLAEVQNSRTWRFLSVRRKLASLLGRGNEQPKG